MKHLLIVLLFGALSTVGATVKYPGPYTWAGQTFVNATVPKLPATLMPTLRVVGPIAGRSQTNALEQ